MSRLRIHDPSVSREEILQERHQAFNRLSPQEKWEQLFSLIKTAVKMNGGKPLKTPQGKGIVISRKR